jgi:hypothetical protein
MSRPLSHRLLAITRHDGWTGANGEGYLGVSLTWGGVDFEPRCFSVLMIPKKGSASDGTSQADAALIEAEFQRLYGISTHQVVLNWVSDTASAAMATTKHLMMAELPSFVSIRAHQEENSLQSPDPGGVIAPDTCKYRSHLIHCLWSMDLV